MELDNRLFKCQNGVGGWCEPELPCLLHILVLVHKIQAEGSAIPVALGKSSTSAHRIRKP